MPLYREGHPGKSVGQRPSTSTGPNKRSLVAAHLRSNEQRNGGTHDPAGNSSTGRIRFGPDSRIIVAHPRIGCRGPVAVQIAASLNSPQLADSKQVARSCKVLCRTLVMQNV